MKKNKKSPTIPGAPTGQSGPQEPARTIPSDISDDVDNMIVALIRIKKDWKLLFGGLAQMQQEMEKLKKKK